MTVNKCTYKRVNERPHDSSPVYEDLGGLSGGGRRAGLHGGGRSVKLLLRLAVAVQLPRQRLRALPAAHQFPQPAAPRRHRRRYRWRHLRRLLLDRPVFEAQFVQVATEGAHRGERGGAGGERGGAGGERGGQRGGAGQRGTLADGRAGGRPLGRGGGGEPTSRLLQVRSLPKKKTDTNN